MAISAFDLFKVGIGPSSSHTVGPMLAANQFVKALKSHGLLDQVSRVTAELYGSLGATGKGHGTPKAVLLGLEGEVPDQVHVPTIAGRVAAIRDNRRLCLLGEHAIDYNHDLDFKLHRRKALAFHPNGMVFAAFDQSGNELSKRTFFSVGGGFVVDESATDSDYIVEDSKQLTYGFDSANELLQICADHDLSISDVMLENETAWRPEQETRDGLLHLWSVMQSCVNNGIANGGILPGGLNVPRRARELHQQLLHRPETAVADPLAVLDWVTLYALAVNEENAAGGRVVTAPTNGAAGIIPAVLHYYMRFIPDASDEMAVRFLLTAAAIGILYKKNASISGAEVGCQGEVGSACSMAAGALAEVLGGSPAQVENAAEIGMEHNLGLTCDPIGGLVQVPCIERNAMASVKAIHAARVALSGDGSHFVSLDKVIRTMRKTGEDMNKRYKETSRGGLATHVLEVPVNIIEC
ncbi:L-serine ammonia-lyase [Porticoccaceae bacterium]|jgi:L-serine dehydratase|nr:L-serine ammonia-lyase [Porticoccaceae bacterium]MDA8885705.1 L-serine ammonia-lyase [Porticoccaceae bacterium]MDA8903286.1 L-serine ammonia-lyase [Porticoccaceae bacterium]MDA8936257.1 L-serine ammonia-lyase [Porticoccaceae bacterium]MDA9565822.1 L-serine ammonia-lyase [Porticoccaceae bacterium]